MPRKRLGLIGFDTNTGLGVQTQMYANYLKPDKVLIADLTDIYLASGKDLQRYPERFSAFHVRATDGFPTVADFDWLLNDIDVVMCAETPLNYDLFTMAHLAGVKSILVPNFEFLDMLREPDLPRPDLLLLPSLWHLKEIKELGVPWLYLPVPIDYRHFKFKQRESARKFLHVAGHKTYMDRNGTDVVLEAMQYVKSNIQLIIRTQQDIGSWLGYTHDRRITIMPMEVENYYELYDDEDVLLLPRHYGGLSLQLNEALATGMPVIMPNVSPQNGFLPKDMLIPASGYTPIETRSTIEWWAVKPKDLAEKIDWLVTNPSMTAWLSAQAGEVANSIAWDRLLPEYRKVIDD